MKIITKYLATTVILYISLALLFLFGLQIFIEFLREFPSLGVGNYGLDKLLTYVLLMLPYDVYQFFPMASLLGVIIALGLLAAHSELIIMRVSGMSLVNIITAIMKVGGILFLIMVLLGEVISPLAQRKAFQIKTTAISGGQVLLTRQGVWLYHKRGITNINSISEQGELRHIVNYQLTDGIKLQSAAYAARGSYQAGQWVFNDGVQTNFQDKATTSSKFSQQLSQLKFSPKLIGVTQLDTDQKNLVELYFYIKYLKQSGLDASKYLFTFWQRVFAPFAVLVMVLLAIPFAFGSLRNTTMGLRMLVGIVFGFGFYILHQFVGPMSMVYQVPPLLASSLPLLIFTFIAGLLLYKAR